MRKNGNGNDRWERVLDSLAHAHGEHEARLSRLEEICQDLHERSIKEDERWRKEDERWRKEDERWRKEDERRQNEDERWAKNHAQWLKNHEQWQENHKRWLKNDERIDRILTKLEKHDGHIDALLKEMHNRKEGR